MADPNIVRIAIHGGIEAIVSALEMHRLSEKVQEYGCRALLHLALNIDVNIAVAAKGGIEVIIAALNTQLQQ